MKIYVATTQISSLISVCGAGQFSKNTKGCTHVMSTRLVQLLPVSNTKAMQISLVPASANSETFIVVQASLNSQVVNPIGWGKTLNDARTAARLYMNGVHKHRFKP